VIHTPGAAHAAVPSYPPPIVDHAVQRRRALAMYRQALPRMTTTPGVE
jgi:deoxyribodipyrimidine photolyase